MANRARQSNLWSSDFFWNSGWRWVRERERGGGERGKKTVKDIWKKPFWISVRCSFFSRLGMLRASLSFFLFFSLTLSYISSSISISLTLSYFLIWALLFILISLIVQCLTLLSTLAHTFIFFLFLSFSLRLIKFHPLFLLQTFNLSPCVILILSRLSNWRYNSLPCLSLSRYFSLSPPLSISLSLSSPFPTFLSFWLCRYPVFSQFPFFQSSIFSASGSFWSKIRRNNFFLGFSF